MKFIDLDTQYNLLKPAINNKIQEVLDSGQYILGNRVAELEIKLANYVGVDYCVTCSSGTDALLMCLLAWDIGPGDAVFTTPFTFAATAEVIHLSGATPVFVDIDSETFTIDPHKLEATIHQISDNGELSPKAIIPVDLFGLCADYKQISKVAEENQLLVLEDAAQSFGAVQNGNKAGNFGDAAGTSFFPAKPLGCYGDGGAIFTNDLELTKILRSIRVHGQGTNKYENVRLGINGRLDTIQAAVLLEKLKIFPSELKKRNEIANQYTTLLKDIVQTPVIPSKNTSSWAQYSILAENSNKRNKIRENLKNSDIPTAIYYQTPLHLQHVYNSLGYRNRDFPVSENISERIFSLPMHPYLHSEDIARICEIIHKTLLKTAN